jgi:adenosine deaminase
MRRFLNALGREQRAEGVEYAEVRISPRRLVSHGFRLSEILTACHEAAAEQDEPQVKLVLLVNRDSPDGYLAEVTELTRDGLPASFVGVDLAGDEVRFPVVDRFVPLFSAARSVGLGITVHAGEFGGPENVWRAVDELGAVRIGHGLSASADDALLQRMATDRILVEASLTSNAFLGATTGPHPVAVFAERDVPFCLNTDVPLHSGASFNDELAAAARVLSLSFEEVVTVQERAMDYAFADRP